MEKYSKFNIISGWIIFAIALLTYTLTLEPTSSLWDCGEFLSSAYKLEVGHPPGAPLFMIMARFFSLFAFGDVTKVAFMVNFMSGMASAFTILFLYWSVTHLLRKLVVKTNIDYNLTNFILIFGSAAVGALAYTFSDTFWFSAVEAEVYASSSFFTAIVFWAILKWENEADQKYANRWLILIAYLMGLSIGVHLLNLLAIPAIVFVYYYKKYPVTNIGLLYATLVGVSILVVVQYGIIPGVVSLAAKFDLFFVNTLQMPLNSGVLVYALLLVAALIFGLYYTHKHQKHLANTAMLMFTVIIIGYSSFTMIVVRSQADPPMNENSPDNVFSLLSYLNREQYGNRPLFYGQYYNAPAIGKEYSYTHVVDKQAGRYKKIRQTNPEYQYDPQFMTLLPRMYSYQSSHKVGYQHWGSINTPDDKPPKFADNLEFMLRYQIGHMYLRYFMWNFVGRQNDSQGHGGILKGNWISGIPFIDNIFVGNQKQLPDDHKNEPTRNTYFFLPFLLGFLGILFMLKNAKKDLWVLTLLFLFTGLAIVFYTNQPPYQPRERDYVYAGSFYVFAMWISFGVMQLFSFLNNVINQKRASVIIAVTLSLMFVPALMAYQNWDDHDRSGRYTTRAYAKNYLESCEPNAIIFTFGDNDTFPLWYAQEVEEIRTDVRVVNLSLLGTDWYINQMRKKAYTSNPVPFGMPPDKYEQGKRDILFVYERINQHSNLKDVMNFIASDNPQTKLAAGTEDEMDYVPTKMFKISVDSAKVLANGTVKPEMAHLIQKEIKWEIKKEMLTKSDMMVLDLIANNNWERPIYFAISIGEENFYGLENYFRHEGFAYRLVPYSQKAPDGTYGHIDSDLLYHKLMNTFTWGRFNADDVWIGEFDKRVLRINNVREIYNKLALTLILENKKQKALEVLDRMMSEFPTDKLPMEAEILKVVENYFKAGANDKAIALAKHVQAYANNQLDYYLSLSPMHLAQADYETKMPLGLLQQLVFTMEANNQTELKETIMADFEKYYARYKSFE